jgi:hypothetical protein
MGREGMARRHALYKMISLVQGTNLIRKEQGIPEAECIGADPKLTLLDIRPAGAAPAAAAAPKKAAAKGAKQKTAAKAPSKKGKKK